ncbi:hypothetical protein MPER_05665, partial [Moniliophthora perniciosa FA553]
YLLLNDFKFVGEEHYIMDFAIHLRQALGIRVVI